MHEKIASIIKQLYNMDVDVVRTRPDAQFGD
jgi:hypothetical protein